MPGLSVAAEIISLMKESARGFVQSNSEPQMKSRLAYCAIHFFLLSSSSNVAIASH